MATLAIVLSVYGLVGGNQSANVGAVGTRFPNGLAVGSGAAVSTTGAFSLGSAGSQLVNLIGTTCNLIGSDASQAASTSKAYDCAVTGLLATDNVIAQIATTTTAASGYGYWSITGAKASTTAGYATVLLFNGTGAAAVPSVHAVGSSTKIWVYR